MACSEGGSYDYAIDRWEGDAGASETGVTGEKIFSATKSGSQYRLLAHPDDGYVFVGWYKTNKLYGHYTTPTDELRDLPMLQPDVVTSSGKAYIVAKRANHLRVRTAAATTSRSRCWSNCCGRATNFVKCRSRSSTPPPASGSATSTRGRTICGCRSCTPRW